MSSQLSDKSKSILQLIAGGCDYGQIVQRHHDVSYNDIFAAANEALRACGESSTPYDHEMAEIKAQYPRAYEKWSDAEDAELRSLSDSGSSEDAMAQHFKRQPSAIRSRLEKLSAQ